MSNNIETFIKKDIRNTWSAESEYKIDNTNMVLVISTYKNYQNFLVTRATIHKIEGLFRSHVMYQDFSKSLQAEHYPRVTSKVVEKQHNDNMKNFEDILAAVKSHYNLA